MTTQIDGGFDPNRSFADTSAYLGSIVGTNPTTTLLGSKALGPYLQNYFSEDNTGILDLLARFNQKIRFDQTGTLRDDSQLKSDIKNYINSFAISGRDVPLTIDDFANDFVEWTLKDAGLTTQSAIDAAKVQYLTNNSSNTTNLPLALYTVIAANLGVVNGSSDLNLLTTATSGLLAIDRLDFAGGNGPSSARVNAFNTDTSIVPDSLGVTSMTDAGSIIPQMVEDSFKGLLKFLDLKNNTYSLSTSDASFIAKPFNLYYARFAAVKTYFDVFKAFNLFASDGSGSPAQTAIFNFVRTVVNDPTGDGLNFAQDFGAWFTAVKQSYLVGLNGNGSLVQSAMGPSAAKVAIINRIYALIAAMIQIIQKTTASQADQLKVLSVLQGEMTNLISKAPILTSTGGGELGDGDTETNNSTLRDELNQVITAWTDTIRAQRDFIKSQAQTQQTNVNNSNDAVNQQASMATALIQQQSTILSAIYR